MFSDNLKNKVKDIHNSDLFGIIVECGNASIISNILLIEKGASTTIYESKQPYNKEIQKKYYGDNYTRSVSKEFIDEILNVEWKNLPENGNFILATSFQLSDINEPFLAHGWIGIAHKSLEKRYYYHFSFPFEGTRHDYLLEIQKIGIDILHSAIDDVININSKYLDKFSDSFNEKKQHLLSTIKQGLYQIDKEEDNFITITRNGIIRFEDLVRDQKGLILQKGTYNPIHQGHLDLMELTEETYPNYVSVFLISIDKYDKNSADLGNLMNIVDSILKEGYFVIVCRKPLFKDSLNWIRKRWKNLPIIFPVGLDTINRIAEAEYKEYEFYIHTHSNLVDTGLNDIDSNIKFHFDYKIKNVYYNSKFLVFARQNYELNSKVEFIKKIIEYNTTYTDPNCLSSTNIRNQLK